MTQVFLIECIAAFHDPITSNPTVSRFSNVTNLSAIKAFSFCRTTHYSTTHTFEPYVLTSSSDIPCWVVVSSISI